VGSKPRLIRPEANRLVLALDARLRRWAWIDLSSVLVPPPLNMRRMDTASSSGKE
jgi:hypothetical protein